MAMLLSDPRVSKALVNLADSGDTEALLFRQTKIESETPRRRPVGSLSVLLADFPRSDLDGFRRANLIPITDADGSVASELWITDEVGDPALAEYVTAESQAAESEEHPRRRRGGSESAEDTVQRLRARIRELEARHQPDPHPRNRPGVQRGSRPLFPAQAETGQPTLTKSNGDA